VMLDGALGPNAMVDTIEVAGFWPVEPLYRDVRDALAGHADIVGCHASHPTAQGTCLYFTLAITTAIDDDDAERRYRGAWDDAMRETLAAGATITHHHGVGLLRAPWIEQELGDALGLWRTIKAALDPAGIMNPGKAGL
ncbi:MAG: FAD-linked oxidase C-terminal domain-containing protein, partial [Actinomycetota bacterium]